MHIASSLFPFYFNSLCIVLIANSTYKEFRGAGMGLGQLVAAVSRFIVGSEDERGWELGTFAFPVDLFLEYAGERVSGVSRFFLLCGRCLGGLRI